MNTGFGELSRLNEFVSNKWRKGLVLATVLLTLAAAAAEWTGAINVLGSESESNTGEGVSEPDGSTEP